MCLSQRGIATYTDTHNFILKEGNKAYTNIMIWYPPLSISFSIHRKLVVIVFVTCTDVSSYNLKDEKDKIV